MADQADPGRTSKHRRGHVEDPDDSLLSVIRNRDGVQGVLDEVVPKIIRLRASNKANERPPLILLGTRVRLPIVGRRPDHLRSEALVVQVRLAPGDESERRFRRTQQHESGERGGQGSLSCASGLGLPRPEGGGIDWVDEGVPVGVRLVRIGAEALFDSIRPAITVPVAEDVVPRPRFGLRGVCIVGIAREALALIPGQAVDGRRLVADRKGIRRGRHRQQGGRSGILRLADETPNRALLAMDQDPQIPELSETPIEAHGDRSVGRHHAALDRLLCLIGDVHRTLRCRFGARFAALREEDWERDPWPALSRALVADSIHRSERVRRGERYEQVQCGPSQEEHLPGRRLTHAVSRARHQWRLRNNQRFQVLDGARVIAQGRNLRRLQRGAVERFRPRGCRRSDVAERIPKFIGNPIAPLVLLSDALVGPRRSGRGRRILALPRQARLRCFAAGCGLGHGCRRPIARLCERRETRQHQEQGLRRKERPAAPSTHFPRSSCLHHGSRDVQRTTPAGSR